MSENIDRNRYTVINSRVSDKKTHLNKTSIGKCPFAEGSAKIHKPSNDLEWKPKLIKLDSPILDSQIPKTQNEPLETTPLNPTTNAEQGFFSRVVSWFSRKK